MDPTTPSFSAAGSLAKTAGPTLQKMSNIDRDKNSRTSGKPQQVEQLQSTTLLEPASEHHDVSKGKVLVVKDFFWDDWLSYIATGILALALIDISVEFLVGSSLGMLCFTPFSNDSSQEFNRDQSAFINSWCSRQLPYTEFYPLFTLVQGVVCLIPHYVWSSVFSSNFSFYFSLVSNMERLRDRNTGEYVPQNSAIVRKLEDEFKDKRTILICYCIKLFVQLFVYFVIAVITFVYFTDFTSDTVCPPASENPSPVFGRVVCTYARFRFLYLLQIANVIMLVIGILILMMGFLMVSVYGYFQVRRFDYRKLAEFTYHSALNPKYFVANRKTFFSDLIETDDMDFMLLKLFAVDTGHAKLLQDVRTSDHMHTLQEADYQLLQIYSSVYTKRNTVRCK